MSEHDPEGGAITGEPEHGPTLYWGHGVLQRNCAHVRRTRDGRPVVDEVDREPVGFALCGCLLIADIDPDAEGVFRCSVCLDLLAQQRQADPPT